MSIPAEKNDFAKGVIHKLVDKIKDPFFPKWSDPSTVTQQFLSNILSISKNTDKYLKTPFIKKWFGVDFEDYPHQMGLPTNKQVADYISGSDGSNRTYLPTPAEVLNISNKRQIINWVSTRRLNRYWTCTVRPPNTIISMLLGKKSLQNK